MRLGNMLASLMMLLAAVACLCCLGLVRAQEGKTGLPAKPEDIEFPNLAYQPPSSEGMRSVLKCGAPLWWARDDGVAKLPGLFRLSVMLRASTLEDPADKVGLCELALTMMREGGTKNYLREELNQQLDRRAATIEVEADENSALLTLTCLDADKEMGLRLFDDVLRRPVFAQAEWSRVQNMRIQALKQRNLVPQDIEKREWQRLMYGPGHPFGRMTTSKSLAALSREDLEAWHKAHCVPSAMLFFGSGALATEAITESLNGLFGDWTSEIKVEARAIPQAKTAAAPGIYLMPRDQDATHVRIGLVGYRREQEDYFAMLLMNYVLGGGSFSSRIPQSVRVRNGLSYVTYSRVDMQESFEGSIYAAAQTPNRTAALAARLMLAEIEKIRDEEVSEAELKAAKEALVGIFPQRFSSRYATARTFAQSEYFGRPADYHTTWRTKVEGVTAQDIRRVARVYLDPEKLVLFMLGRAEEIKAGNPDDKERSTTLQQLEKKVLLCPLPDPETLSASDPIPQD